MKLKFIMTTLILGIFISGCGQIASKTDEKDNIKTNISINTDDEEIPLPKNENQILLYNDKEQKFFVYDKEKKQADSTAGENYFQYRFQTPDVNVFTSGNSINNNFKIIEYKDDKINVLHTMGKNEAIFPLAKKNSNELFFVKYYYDKDGNEDINSREIVLYNKNNDKFTSIFKGDGILISSGSYENKMLYFTAYNNEKDNYDVYKIKIGQKPEKIQEGALSPYINIYDGKLYVDTEFTVDGDGNKFQKAVNYFFEDKRISFFGENHLIVISNIEDNSLIDAPENILGFILNEQGEMKIYKENEEIMLNLK